MDNQYYPHLASPITIGNVTFKNRIFGAPMSNPELDPDCHMRKEDMAFHENRAKGGLASVAIGLGIGLYDGIIGPGTGTFAIIAFTTLMGFDLRTAGGNAKVLNLASNYASLVTYLMNGLVIFSVGIPCAVSGIVGNLLGSHFALKNGAKFIRPMMLVVLVLLLGKLVSDAVL